jgi:hypothetical protein
MKETLRVPIQQITVTIKEGTHLAEVMKRIAIKYIHVGKKNG